MEYKQEFMGLIDYTSLHGDQTEERIQQLAKKACNLSGSALDNLGNVAAAVCVYPRYISLLKDAFVQAKLPILNVASVVNFPKGELPLEEVIAEIRYILQQGADEIELVIPHPTKQAEYIERTDFIQACRNESHGKVLKLIIESGQLSSTGIKRYAEIGIEAGVDFLSTSTGKTDVAATLQAAEIMLNCIKASGKPCGFKATASTKGQVTETVAISYITLAESILGKNFIESKSFRFGLSAAF